MTKEEMEITPAAALKVLRSGDIAPWRDFRWRHGQSHYSGLYWSSTTGGHLAYESRLELARLLLADFDPQVGWIVSQPFLIEATVSGQTRRHVPDFALIDRQGLITIVNVKPASRLGDAKVAATLAWAGVAFGLRGATRSGLAPRKSCLRMSASWPAIAAGTGLTARSSTTPWPPWLNRGASEASRLGVQPSALRR